MKVMTMFYGKNVTRVRVVLAGVLAAALVSFAVPTPAMAQDDPNPGALTFTGGVDFPTIYFFRGIRQESDAKLTMWPYGDLGIALFSGDGGLKSVGVNVGVWNSVQTGSAGTDGAERSRPLRRGFLHHAQPRIWRWIHGGRDVHGADQSQPDVQHHQGISAQGLEGAHARALRVPGVGTDRRRPGGRRQPQGHVSRARRGSKLATRGGWTDARSPRQARSGPQNYYEAPTGDNFDGPSENSSFGFFDIGGLVTVPLKGVPSKFGAWNIHGGVDVLFLGHGTKYFNVDPAGERSDNKVIGLFGIGVGY